MLTMTNTVPFLWTFYNFLYPCRFCPLHPCSSLSTTNHLTLGQSYFLSLNKNTSWIPCIQIYFPMQLFLPETHSQIMIITFNPSNFCSTEITEKWILVNCHTPFYSKAYERTSHNLLWPYTSLQYSFLMWQKKTHSLTDQNI